MAKNKLRFKKIFTLLLSLSLLLSLFALSAFAEESVGGDKTVQSEGDLSQKAPEKEDATDAVSPENTSTGESPEAIGNADRDDGNFFTSLFEDLKANLSEILSALSLICSIILMFVYKSGFIPMVKDGVIALSSRVKSIGEETDKMSKDSSEVKELLKSSLRGTSEKLSEMESDLFSLSEKLSDLESLKAKADAEAGVLSLEVEMLYELFMSSSLPQYEKDRVGEMIRSMKSKLKGEAE